jgi:hypothetical protein
MKNELATALSNYLACTTIGSVSTKQPLLLSGEEAKLVKKKVFGRSAIHGTRGKTIDIYITQYRLILVESKTLITYPTMISLWMNLGESFSPYNGLNWKIKTIKNKQVRFYQSEKELLAKYTNDRNISENRKFLNKIITKDYAKEKFIKILKCKGLADLIISAEYQPIEVDFLLPHLERTSEEDVRRAHGTGAL